MIENAPSVSGRLNARHPAPLPERSHHIDVIRGLALFGVLLVNELTMYRVPLLEHVLAPGAGKSPLDSLVSQAVAILLEFKALTIFSFLFGAGMAIQSERGAANDASTTRFLARRLGWLALFGLVHMVAISNGDILALYAVCGLMLLPVLRLSSLALAYIGAALIVVPEIVPFRPSLPSADEAAAHLIRAREVYSTGSFENLTSFRLYEIGALILPLLAGIAPRTIGVMMWGVAGWRSGILQKPGEHKGTLTVAFVCAISAAPWSPLIVAVAYVSGFLLVLPKLRESTVAGFAAVGRMALTNYLLQSVILGFVFYGYGFGLLGRVGTATAAALGVLLYVIQVKVSSLWLGYFQFGPMEWVWRSLAYREWQQMRRVSAFSEVKHDAA
ncbi:MAG TPA: DUF418 domain-containing protein [Bryobacteraceae bacterium]|nr:DUF418 domain-containing protein [Bryobacteraceae bacterium]